MKDKKNNLILVVAAVLLVLVCMEVVLRISGIARMSARFTCFDAVLGKVYCATAAGEFDKGSYHNYLEINSAGMIDREYPQLKPAGTRRIALLGDSFAASEYLQTAEKFEGILERELSRDLGVPVEILNFGISGSETWNQLQLFHRMAASYQPDITLLAFYWGNDVSDNIEQLQNGNPDPRQEDYEPSWRARVKAVRKGFNKVLWENSLLYQVVHDGTGRVEQLVKRWLRPDYLAEIDRITIDNTLPDEAIVRPLADTDSIEDDVFFQDSDGWQLTRELILKLNAEVVAAGSRLLVLHFPSEALIRSGISLPDQAFNRFLARHDIPYISLFDDYRQLQPEQLQAHFIPGDGHWTRYGHRYIAERSRDQLLKLLLAPSRPFLR